MRRLGGAVVLILMATSTVGAQQLYSRDDRVSSAIYRELITLPYYGVFDHMKFEVNKGGVVTLRGAVRNPTLKDDAESRVRSVEGVEEVRNEIDVLPASPQDDRIRLVRSDRTLPKSTQPSKVTSSTTAVRWATGCVFWKRASIHKEGGDV
jgi:hyperosmotically inducible protein